MGQTKPVKTTSSFEKADVAEQTPILSHACCLILSLAGPFQNSRWAKMFVFHGHSTIHILSLAGPLQNSEATVFFLKKTLRSL
jgi:hypothetical protein